MNPVNLTFPLLPARNLPPKGTAGTKRGIFGSLRVRLPLEPGQKGNGPPFPRQALFQTSPFPERRFSRKALFHTGACPYGHIAPQSSAPQKKRGLQVSGRSGSQRELAERSSSPNQTVKYQNRRLPKPMRPRARGFARL